MVCLTVVLAYNEVMFLDWCFLVTYLNQVFFRHHGALCEGSRDGVLGVW
jgi:hypothetical protein